MATVTHYTPTCSTQLICSKGGLHQAQPLNIVCLDPLCRTSPLACSICYTEAHKHHKVTALHKFLDDYKRSIGDSNPGLMQKKIMKRFSQLEELMGNFRNNFLRQLDHFMVSLEQYATFLLGQGATRSEIRAFLNIELEPERLKQFNNESDLLKSVQFIINNSRCDDSGSLINASEILKQNKDRVSALLDKMVYMTEFCERSITDALSSLNFASSTLREEKSLFNRNLSNLSKGGAHPINLAHFEKEQSKLSKLIQESSNLIFEDSQKACNQGLFDDLPSALPNFLFGKHRSDCITISNNGLSVASSVNAKKPQYCLAWPNLNMEPLSTKQWSLQIQKCRDFASENTMAVGIARFSDMKLAKFQGSPTNCLMVSSQGYTTLNGKVEKTDFVYREGDILSFKYDPYYGILEIKKPNGRKLTLKALGTGDDPVYICTRFTYASDQVQLL